MSNYVKGVDLLQSLCYKPAKFVIFDDGDARNRLKTALLTVEASRKAQTSDESNDPAALSHGVRMRYTRSGELDDSITLGTRARGRTLPLLNLTLELPFGGFFYA